jgi:hypothetical protein
MRRSRHTPQQIIRKLRDAEVMLGEGKTVAEAAKELGVSSPGGLPLGSGENGEMMCGSSA